jgi:hypothetical protein
VSSAVLSVLFASGAPLAAHASLASRAPFSPPAAFSPASRGNAMVGIGFGVSLRCERDGLVVSTGGPRPADELRFLGTAGAAPEPGGRLPGVVNSFVGRDPSAWLRDAPRFDSVVYRNLWPGIDLRVYGSAGGIEFDAIVHPGARPSRIGFEAASGGLAADGSGGISWAGTGLALRPPLLYQSVDGRRRPVSGAFRLAPDGRLGFEVGPYDRRGDLTIDPELVHSTYLGGDGAASGSPFDGAAGDAAYNVARDDAGNTFVVGYTGSSNFPAVDPIATTAAGNEDAFIAKFDADGVPQFISVIGGSKIDRFVGVALGPDGSIYISGYTQSTDLPTTAGVFAHDYPNDLQSFNLSGFAVKLPPAGDRIDYLTYVGGGYTDITYRIAADVDGSVVLGGYTFQSTYGGMLRRFGTPGGLDGLVLKLNPAASALVFVDAIGGGGLDVFNDLKIDADGRAYFGGYTNSLDFPTTAGAYKTTCACDPTSAPNDQSGVFGRLSADGSFLDYASYLAGSETKVGAVAADHAGGMWVTGTTTDRSFATLGGPAQGSFGAGTQDAFVFHADGQGRGLYASFLGSATPSPANAGILGGRGITTSLSGSTIYVCGGLGPPPGALPTVLPIPGGDHFGGGQFDGFVAAFDRSGALLFSSYVGGSGDDLMYKLAADRCGNVSAVGQTTSTDFPVAGQPFQDHYAGQAGRPNATLSVFQFGDGRQDCRVVLPAGSPGAVIINPRP